jgi:AcrR family transcriptional regulator
MSSLNRLNSIGNNPPLTDRQVALSIQPRRLVKLEVDLIPQIKQRWEKILADRITDRARAERAINDLYNYGDLAQPRILWTENPLTAMMILINRPDLVDIASSLLSKIWTSCNQEIERQIDPEFTRVVMAYANPRAQIIDTPATIAADPLGDFLNQVSIAKIQQVYPQLDVATLPAALQDYRIAYLSYFDYFRQIGLDLPQVTPAIELATSCGCCWAFANIAIVTPKPAEIEFTDRGVLSALVYDGVNIID